MALFTVELAGRVRLRKLLLMLITFLVVFCATFVYLFEVFEISVHKVVAFSTFSAATAAVLVTFTAYGR